MTRRCNLRCVHCRSHSPLVAGAVEQAGRDLQELREYVGEHQLVSLPGDPIEITWVDNMGETETGTAEIS